MQYVLPVKHTQLYVRQDSWLGVLNGLPAGQQRNSGLFVGRDKRFPFLQNVQTGCGAHPAPCTMHIRDSFSCIIWLDYAADRLAQSRVKVKNAYSWTPKSATCHHYVHRNTSVCCLHSYINCYSFVCWTDVQVAQLWEVWHHKAMFCNCLQIPFLH
jgi:hypothetical protein